VVKGARSQCKSDLRGSARKFRFFALPAAPAHSDGMLKRILFQIQLGAGRAGQFRAKPNAATGDAGLSNRFAKGGR